MTTQPVVAPDDLSDLDLLPAFHFPCKACRHGVPCEQQAAWLARAVCEWCGPRTSYLCDEHAEHGDVDACESLMWHCRRDGGCIGILALYPFG